MSDEPKAVKPRLNIRFLYHYCNDIAAMRAFYTDALGMQETGHMDDEGFGWLCYDCEGLQLMFFRWDAPLPTAEGFAAQPGDGGGESSRASVSIEVPEEDFAAVYARLQTAGAVAMTDAPTWRQDSYWGWTVNDPMGNTIELYYSPKEKPEGGPPTWPTAS